MSLRLPSIDAMHRCAGTLVLILAACGHATGANGDASSGLDAAGFDTLEVSAEPGPDGTAGDVNMADSPADIASFTDAAADSPLDSCVPGTCGDACVPGTCGTCPIFDVPSTCESAPYSCGIQGDGLGGILQCGSCPSPLLCSLGQCVSPADAGPCVPATCSDYAADCGSLSDGCGNALHCGTCAAPEYCGGGGPHRCGGVCTMEPNVRDMDCGVSLVCRPNPAATDAAGQ